MIPADQARALAGDIIDWLRDGCEAIFLAGDLRRGAAEVAGIAIVCVPRVEHLPRIGLQPERHDLLAERVTRWLALGRWVPDAAVRRWGDRVKRLRVPSADCPVELVMARRANLGNMLALRTGDEAFAKALVTKRRHGGLLPDGLYHRHGYLWDYAPGNDRRAMLLHPPRPALPCTTEEQFFRRLGFPEAPDPASRDRIGAQTWRVFFERRAAGALPAGRREGR